MKFIKIPFLLLWRFWFYFLIFVTIILMAPLLFILTIKEESYPQFWKLIRVWAKVLIYGMGFRLKFQFDQHIDPTKSYMFCPNHAAITFAPINFANSTAVKPTPPEAPKTKTVSSFNKFALSFSA